MPRPGTELLRASPAVQRPGARVIRGCDSLGEMETGSTGRRCGTHCPWGPRAEGWGRWPSWGQGSGQAPEFVFRVTVYCQLPPVVGSGLCP